MMNVNNVDGMGVVKTFMQKRKVYLEEILINTKI
jgi:hypothetical protein